MNIDGKPSPVAKYDNATNSILIHTDEDSAVGSHQVVLRDCNALERLLELNLYINITDQSYPVPVTDIKTSFNLNNGDTLSYRIPKLVSPGNIDTPEVYVTTMTAQEDKYPPFLSYMNNTQTIVLFPNSTQVSGRTFYFSIIVKQMHSDSVLYPYYCTVKVGGPIIDTNYTINYTLVNYTVNWIDSKYGSIKFNHPMNMTWLKANFNSVFRYYWTNVDFKVNKVEQKFKDFEITNWGAKDNMTVNFTMTFSKPYDIGLLTNKHDNVVFQLKRGWQGNEAWYCQLF